MRPPLVYSASGALLVFIVGTLVGFTWRDDAAVNPRRETPTTRRGPDVLLVKGVDSGNGADNGADRTADARVLSPAPASGLSAVPIATQARHPASEIARNALRFTAFIDGDGVYGAGILLDDHGHILTCSHVIDRLAEIRVSFADGRSFVATLLEADPKLDLALLKIDADRSSGLTPAGITTVEAGDDLYAMGAPRKMKFSLHRGMASFVGRSFDNLYYLQTDLALNAGSSGGPVMNSLGQVVAISSFVLRRSEGLSFALPIDYAYRRFSHILSAPPAPERVVFERWLSSFDASATSVN